MSVQTNLQLGRVGLKKVFFVEAQKVPDQYLDVVGRIDSTNQTFERYKQLKGLGMAEETGEDAKVKFDNLAQLFTRDFAPTLYTKGIKFSLQTIFTDQYNQLKNMQPAFARAFKHKRNQVFANLDNLGFADTTYGMNSEVLYYASHSMGTGITGSNRPATDIAFNATAVEQMLKELRKQKSARSTPQPIVGKILIKLPPDLEPDGFRVLGSLLQAGTADNDTNYAKTRADMRVNDYYTSTTAWFARTADDFSHGLFGLNQMPYDIMQLPMDEQLEHKWAAYESYIVGWFDWHGTWGTSGA